MGSISQEEINADLFDEVQRLKAMSSRQQENFEVLAKHPFAFFVSKLIPIPNRAKILSVITMESLCDWQDIMYGYHGR